MTEDIWKYIEIMEEEAIPQLSVNCVIMGFHERALKVVVNKIVTGDRQFTVLPGGYVKQTEDLSEAVERVVRESTGLENMLLKQFSVFGQASRSFAQELALTAEPRSESDQILLNWFTKRFISICYMALVDFQKIELNPTAFYESALWLTMDQAGTLAMDHGEILRTAQEFLLKEMPYTPVLSNLLPSRFTLPELQSLMEAILRRQFDRPNFRRKILGTGLLVKVGVDNNGRSRPADIYRFKYGKNTPPLHDLKFGF